MRRTTLAWILLAPTVADALRNAQSIYHLPDCVLDALAVAAAEQRWTAQDAEDQARCAHAWGPRYRMPAKRRMDNVAGEYADPSWRPVDVAIACGYLPPVLARGVLRPSRRALRQHQAEALQSVILKARSAPHSELARRLRAECPGLSLRIARKTRALEPARRLRFHMTAARAWSGARKTRPVLHSRSRAGRGSRKSRTTDPPSDSDDPDGGHPVPADSPAAPAAPSRDELHWPTPANDWPIQTEPDAVPARTNEMDPNGSVDATLTPEEKSLLDFLVEQAFRRLLERKMPPC